MTDSVFHFDNSYARDLEGFFVPWRPQPVPAPRSLFLNAALAQELGLDVAALAGEAGAAIFAGNVVPEGAEPIAQAYAGHQFGGFSPQLGDGRAVLLGEVIDREGRRRDIALKGSGRTPFSRGGDGRAAVGPMLREVLIGEAMHALGIPTTRALAVVATGERVYREAVLPGAVLTRVADSHIRVGTFEFFAARGDSARVRELAEYAIARHDPDLAGTPGRFLALLERVAERQAALVAQWMNVGFIHGVMNTDNMTLSGETIDYGPCAFLEAYDPATVFSSIDAQGRYAFGRQPAIAQWNLARLAEALLTLLGDDTEQAVAQATPVVHAFASRYDRHLRRGQIAKRGLRAATGAGDATSRADGADTVDAAPGSDAALGGRSGVAPDGRSDAALADAWLALLQAWRVDFTLGWRRLADAAAGDDAPLRALFADPGAPDEWLARWRERCARDDEGPLHDDGPSQELGAEDPGAARAARMRRVNPLVIPRNHRVEEALSAASDQEDLAPFERLLDALRQPYDQTAESSAYAQPAPPEVTACYRTYCGT